MSTTTTKAPTPATPTPDRGDQRATPPVLSIRDRIAAKPQTPRELMTLPEWDVTIELRGVTLGQRSKIMQEGYVTDAKGTRPVFETFYPLLLIASCHDPVSGDPVFPSTTPAEAEASTAFIQGLNPAVVDRMAKRAMALSGMTEEARPKNDSDSTATSGIDTPSRSS